MYRILKTQIKGKINEFRKIGNRGYGYYVWKPYIILSLLKKNKTDYIFYHDAGRIDNISYELTSYPDKVLEHIKKNNLNFFLGQQIPHHGNLSKWTKKDCFQIMQTDNSFFYNKIDS